MHDVVVDTVGVRAGLAAIFADRDHILIRAELHLDATRNEAHQMLYVRSRVAVDRLVTAALDAEGRHVGTWSARSAIAHLDGVALDTASQRREAAEFTATMRARLEGVFPTLGG